MFLLASAMAKRDQQNIVAEVSKSDIQ